MQSPKWIQHTNDFVKRRFVHSLLLVLAAGWFFPDVGLALKRWELARLPGTHWTLDFPTLALAIMMLSSSTQCRFSEFGGLVVKRRAGMVILAMLYILVPAIAVFTTVSVIGLFRSEASRELQLGLVLCSLVPVALTSSMWVRLNSGNVPLLVAVVTLTTGIAAASIPVYLSILPGLETAQIHVPFEDLMNQLLVAVTLPLAIGLSLRKFVPRWVDDAQPLFSFLGTLSLLVLLATNVSLAAPKLQIWQGNLLPVTGLMTLALNLAFFGLGLVAARSLGLLYKDAVTLVFATGMRSTGTAMVIGMVSMGHMPLVTVPAAIFSISQQLLAGWLTQKMQRSSLPWLGARSGHGVEELRACIKDALRRSRSGAEGVSVLVFRTSPKAGQAELASDLSWARRQLRCSDSIFTLADHTYAIVCPQTPKAGAERVRLKLLHSLKSIGLEAQTNIAHSSSSKGPTQLLNASAVHSAPKKQGSRQWVLAS